MTNPFDVFDRIWERWKTSSRRLQLADAHVDQTHVHHALLTALIGIGIGLTLDRYTTLSEIVALRSGIMVMWAFYFVREWLTWRLVAMFKNARIWLRSRTRDVEVYFAVKWWDGVCDIVVPMWVTAPLVFESYELLVGLSALVVLLYFFLRPIDERVRNICDTCGEPYYAEPPTYKHDCNTPTLFMCYGGPCDGERRTIEGTLGYAGGRYVFSSARNGFQWWSNSLGEKTT